jgi:hypothetical protein
VGFERITFVRFRAAAALWHCCWSNITDLGRPRPYLDQRGFDCRAVPPHFRVARRTIMARNRLCGNHDWPFWSMSQRRTDKGHCPQTHQVCRTSRSAGNLRKVLRPVRQRQLFKVVTAIRNINQGISKDCDQVHAEGNSRATSRRHETRHEAAGNIRSSALVVMQLAPLGGCCAITCRELGIRRPRHFPPKLS